MSYLIIPAAKVSVGGSLLRRLYGTERVKKKEKKGIRVRVSESAKASIFVGMKRMGRDDGNNYGNCHSGL